MLTRKENRRRSEEGFWPEIASPVGWDGAWVLPQGNPVVSHCPSPRGNNAAEVPQIRGVSDSAFMVPNGSNKMQEHPVRCHLVAPSLGNLGTGFACIVGIPRFTEREKQKWQEGQNLILACRMNGKDSSVPTLSQGLAHYPLTDHADSSLPCRILALITRQEEK